MTKKLLKMDLYKQRSTLTLDSFCAKLKKKQSSALVILFLKWRGIYFRHSKRNTLEFVGKWRTKVS